MLLSSCDSRNLNLSPFCNLTSTSLAMWQPSVLETYGNLKTDYIEQISGPLRLKYPNSMADEELITALTKVKPCKGLCSNLPHKQIMKFCCYALLQPPYILFVIDLLFHREICTTMPTKRILPLWTSSLESQLCSVCSTLKARIDSIEDFLFSEFERSPKMTWLDFISGFGGICGLCLGISFVSLVEILYWFSIRLCQNFWSN